MYHRHTLIHRTTRSGICTVHPRGELDSSSTELLRGCLDLAVHDARFVVVDLSGVTFLDCHTLGVLIGAAARARSRRGALSLAAASPAAHQILHAFDLYSSLGGHRDVPDQQQHFQALVDTPLPT